MHRRLFLAASASAVSGPARAQRRSGTLRLGFLSIYARNSGQHLVGCFVAELERLGWIEGRNLSIDYRWAGGDLEKTARYAEELSRLGVDIVATNSTPAAQALKKVTAGTGTPVVFMSVSDPVASGIVSSIPRPGANVTGVSNFFSANSAKLIEPLQLVAPHLDRVIIVRDAENTGKGLDAQGILDGARTVGLAAVDGAVKDQGGIERLFAGMDSQPPPGMIVLLDAVTLRHRDFILGRIGDLRLPAIYQVRDFVEAGGLMSYGLDLCRHFARAATYVDRIARGAKPADLPVELPSTFEFVVNLGAARALGLQIPKELLLRADKVID